MRKQKLITNSFFGLFQLILTAILTLFSVPVFINKLGIQLYGVFAIVSVIGNLNILTNFGLNSALLVYIAKQGKCKESDHDILTTQILLAAILVPFLFVVITYKEFIILRLLSVPEEFAYEASRLLIFMVFSNSALLFGQTYTAVLDAQQKIYQTSIFQFLYSLVYWLGLLIIVSNGGGIDDLGIVILFAALFWFTIVLISFYKSWGNLDVTEFLIHFKSSARKQLIYGSKIYLSGLIGFLFEPLSKLLLSRYIGLNSVALFEIGMKIKGQFNGLFSKMFYPFLPFIAKNSSENDLKSKIFDFSKKIQLIVIPFAITLAYTLSYLTKLWLGSGNYEEVAIFIIILTSVMIIFSPPVIPIYQYLSANNLAIKNVWIQLSSVIVNLLFFFTSYKIIGMYAILLSNSFGLLASYILCNYYQVKYLEVNWKNEFSFYIKIIVFGVMTFIICLLIKLYIEIGWWDLIIYPAIIVSMFIIFLRSFKLITIKDLNIYLGTKSHINTKLSKLLIS